MNKILINTVKKNNVTFIGILFLLAALSLSIGFLCLYLIQSGNFVLYKFFLNIILIVMFLMGVYIFINMVFVIQLLNDKKISEMKSKLVKFSMLLIYPNILNVCSVLGLEKDKVRKVFSDINNRLILSKKYSISPERILILIPHCLQKKECIHKITSNIQNCKRCGACDVDKLIELQNKYGVRLHMATGGTLARKIVQEIHPEAIIAVACERDLSSGIQDVKGIPVMGIINERPEGPCVNTRVNLDQVERSIQYLIAEGE